jgi:recombination protein RecT
MSGLPAIKQTLNNPKVMSSIIQRIGENNFRDFSSSVLELVSSDSKLQECEPNNLIQECLKAGALRLPLSKNLGFAYIIPYKIKGKMTANYQTGYKGLIQLAIRSGQFKHLNAGIIYEGEEIIEDRIKGTFEIKGEKNSDKAIGYFSYMSLLNGFEKGLFWTKEKCHEHGKKYSKAYNYSSSVWQSDPDSMCVKTVLLQLISKFAPLSIEMQTAVINDASDAIFNDDNTPDFSDANTGEVVDIDNDTQEAEFEEKTDIDEQESKDESSAFAEPEY